MSPFDNFKFTDFCVAALLTYVKMSAFQCMLFNRFLSNLLRYYILYLFPVIVYLYRWILNTRSEYCRRRLLILQAGESVFKIIKTKRYMYISSRDHSLISLDQYSYCVRHKIARALFPAHLQASNWVFLLGTFNLQTMEISEEIIHMGL